MKRLVPAVWLTVLGAALLMLVGGCATNPDSDNASVRPWNAPMGWENGLPSTMQEGR